MQLHLLSFKRRYHPRKSTHLHLCTSYCLVHKASYRTTVSGCCLTPSPQKCYFTNDQSPKHQSQFSEGTEKRSYQRYVICVKETTVFLITTGKKKRPSRISIVQFCRNHQIHPELVASHHTRSTSDVFARTKT